MSRTTTDALYLVTIVTFILALRFLSSPEARTQGELDRRRRDDARDRRHARPGRPRKLRTDRDRDGRRRRRRAGRCSHGEDDRDAADGRPLQRGRWRRGSTDLARRVSPLRWGLHNRRGHLHGAVGTDRIGLVLRLARRVREAAGADLGPSDRVPRPADRERADHRHRRRARRLDLRRRRHPGPDLRPHRRGARVRRHVRPSDRRRRHARRDLAAQRLHRACRVGHRLRAPQQRPDRGGCTRRRLRHPADAVDGQGDEPVDHERPLRGVRPGAGRSRDGAGSTTAGPSERPRPRTSPWCCRSPAR